MYLTHLPSSSLMVSVLLSGFQSYLIKQCTQANGIVLDGFLGSASTLMACEQMDRICYGVELEPKFVDVAVKRYLEYKSNSSDVYVIRDGNKISYEDAIAGMEVDTEDGTTE